MKTQISKTFFSLVMGAILVFGFTFFADLTCSLAQEANEPQPPAETAPPDAAAAEPKEPAPADQRPEEPPSEERRESGRRDRDGGPPPGERRGDYDRRDDRRDNERRDGGRGGRGPESPFPPSPDGVNKMRFNIRLQPWRDVVELFAEQADLSLMAKTYPQGSFNYRDDEKYFTPDEAIDLLNQFLLLEEFTLVRKDKVLILYDLGAGGSLGTIPEFLVQTIFPDDLEKHGKFEIVRCQFTLKRITPDKIQTEIERILGPQGSMSIMPLSQTIQVTETVSNLLAIRDIIDKLDSVVDGSRNLRVFELKNVAADEALLITRNLMGVATEDQNFRAIADMSGKKIWLGGRSDMIEQGLEILEKIDKSYTVAESEWGPIQFKVFPIDTAELATVLAVCQTLLAENPKKGTRLSIDQGTNSLVAYAYLDDMKLIKNAIDAMQGDAARNEVIPLSKLTTASAVQMIEKFFTGDSSTVKAPIVEADASSKLLFVRGTSSQIRQIRELLALKGETFDVVSTTPRVPSGKPIRTISLSPSTAEMLIEQIQQVWDKSGIANEIKVVKPSAIAPAMKSDVAAPTFTTPAVMREEPAAQPDDRPERRFRRPPMFEEGGGFGSPVAPVPGGVPDANNNDVLQNNTQVEPVVELIDTLFGPPSPNFNRSTQNWNEGVPGVYRNVAFTRILEDEAQAARELSPEALQYLREAARNAATQQETKPTGKGAPIVLSIGPSGLMLASDDLEALDALEELIETLSNEAILTTPFLKPYYLQYLSADSASSMLNKLMGVSSSSSSSDSVVDESGAGLLLNVPGSLGTIYATGDVTITPDTRLNMIYVNANPVDHYTIEKKLLPVLDLGEGPEEVKRKSTPRMIQLKNMKADEAKELVQTAFADKMQGGAANRAGAAGARGAVPGGPQMGGPGGFNPQMMQQMMQQMQGGRNRGNTNAEEEEKMTLSVYTPTNALIVNAPEVLFNQVKAFLDEMETIAGELDMVTEVVVVKDINPQSLQAAISKISGSDSITMSGTVTQPRGATEINTTTGGVIATGVTTSGTGTTGGRGGFGGGGFGGGGFGGGGGGIGGLMGILGGGNRGPTMGGAAPAMGGGGTRTFGGAAPAMGGGTRTFGGGTQGGGNRSFGGQGGRR